MILRSSTLYHYCRSVNLSAFRFSSSVVDPIRISESGLYGWGFNERGQLGQGKSTKLIPRMQKLHLPTIPFSHLDYTHALAQEESSIFIVKDELGKNLFYGVGLGKAGNCGFIQDDPVFEPILFQNPDESDSNELISTEIKQVALGRFHVLYVTDNGKLFVSGSSNQGQLGIEGELSPKTFPVKLDAVADIKVKEASGGSFHSIIIDDDGSVYSWGANLCYQLGHGDCNPRFAPQLVSDVFQAKTGDTSIFHTIIVTEDNCLIGWGQNKDGQVGNPNRATNSVSNPTEIPHKILDDIIKVRCAAKHNIILTENGDVYAFGSNQMSQLGQEVLQISAQRKPMMIESLSGLDIDDVIVGEYHNFAISRKQGKVYAWGYGPDYQFGIVDCAHWTEPKLIAHIEPDLYLKDISFGNAHNWMIVIPK